MDFKVLGRLLGYVIRHYKVACLFTLIFIILASLASVSVSLFIQVLIDDYITPSWSISDRERCAMSAMICSRIWNGCRSLISTRMLMATS